MFRLGLCCAALSIVVVGCADEGTVSPAPLPCDQAASASLRACVHTYSTAIADCYLDSDEPCPEDHEPTTAALSDLRTSVETACSETGLFGLDGTASAGRLTQACQAEASSLAWRTYGGPQGAVFGDASAEARDCLATAHEAAATMVEASLGAVADCLEDEACDGSELTDRRAKLRSEAVLTVEGACEDLAAIIAIGPETYVARAAAQVDCLAATAHERTEELGLRCGPGYAQLDAPRGRWTRVEVDGERWGTRCGNGSPYSFHIRLAPEGARLDRVVVGLQGGGVCLFEEDCGAKWQTSPGLFTAEDDEPPSTGIMSTDPVHNPFSEWTMVFLPYCTQDVFAGGGVEEQLGEVTVARYGSVNMRAALQMVRDVIWKRMDAEGGLGYRPDELVALFGGWSAGGYGTLYNYHWLLDDLGWPRTSAYPDAGLAIDNGKTLGVKGLGAVKIPAWGMRPHLPPYCFGEDCAAGEVLFEALSPRLRRAPEQQVLAVSNTLDTTQATDAFFEDDASFINQLRSTYCETKDLPGIQWYLTSESSESVHVVTLRPEHWEGSVDGVVMKDWFARAVTEPDAITDRAEEGDFTTTVDGVMPFPCEP